MDKLVKVVFHDNFKKRYRDFADSNEKLKKKIDKDIKKLAENTEEVALNCTNVIDYEKGFGFFDENKEVRIVFQLKEGILVLLDIKFKNQLEEMEVCDLCSSILESY